MRASPVFYSVAAQATRNRIFAGDALRVSYYTRRTLRYKAVLVPQRAVPATPPPPLSSDQESDVTTLYTPELAIAFSGSKIARSPSRAAAMTARHSIYNSWSQPYPNLFEDGDFDEENIHPSDIEVIDLTNDSDDDEEEHPAAISCKTTLNPTRAAEASNKRGPHKAQSLQNPLVETLMSPEIPASPSPNTLFLAANQLTNTVTGVPSEDSFRTIAASSPCNLESIQEEEDDDDDDGVKEANEEKGESAISFGAPLLLQQHHDGQESELDARPSDGSQSIPAGRPLSPCQPRSREDANYQLQYATCLDILSQRQWVPGIGQSLCEVWIWLPTDAAKQMQNFSQVRRRKSLRKRKQLGVLTQHNPEQGRSQKSVRSSVE